MSEPYAPYKFSVGDMVELPMSHQEGVIVRLGDRTKKDGFPTYGVLVDNSWEIENIDERLMGLPISSTSEQKSMIRPTRTAEKIASIREVLKEVRRYVRTDIEHVLAEIGSIQCDMKSACDLADGLFTGVQERLYRIEANLLVGIKFIQVSPEVLEGYIDGAVFELGLKIQD